MKKGSTIAGLSFGGTRTLNMTNNVYEDISIELESGSLYVFNP